ncbi:hypothetical protein VNO78_28673 [Psophocarpus tetragonolobus]|uniref:DEAD-box RNA helicase Q domain-containing protein n=1 Tax=Psophocarpus tetragonolobus TaxID=3891 RepID=A0AAN9WYF3_PSOTE
MQEQIQCKDNLEEKPKEANSQHAKRLLPTSTTCLTCALTATKSKLSNEILKVVEKVGYKTPSPIQMTAISFSLHQRDVLALPRLVVSIIVDNPLRSKILRSGKCNYVVLDEAEHGFKPQVMGVLDVTSFSNLKPENKDEELDKNKIYWTTYMFNTTMPPTIERLAGKYSRNPIVINIGNVGKAN